jgi:uncharacterized membrane protein (UPF0127 family)
MSPAPVVRLETPQGRPLCTCRVAATPLRRLAGLLGRRGLPEDGGLLIRPAPSVHTWFMRFPLDVVFLDADMRVLRVRAGMRPWQIAGCRGARMALELPAGRARAAGVAPGDRLRERR